MVMIFSLDFSVFFGTDQLISTGFWWLWRRWKQDPQDTMRNEAMGAIFGRWESTSSSPLWRVMTANAAHIDPPCPIKLHRPGEVAGWMAMSSRMQTRNWESVTSWDGGFFIICQCQWRFNQMERWTYLTSRPFTPFRLATTIKFLEDIMSNVKQKPLGTTRKVESEGWQFHPICSIIALVAT